MSEKYEYQEFPQYVPNARGFLAVLGQMSQEDMAAAVEYVHEHDGEFMECDLSQVIVAAERLLTLACKAKVGE